MTLAATALASGANVSAARAAQNRPPMVPPLTSPTDTDLGHWDTSAVTAALSIDSATTTGSSSGGGSWTALGGGAAGAGASSASATVAAAAAMAAASAAGAAAQRLQWKVDGVGGGGASSGALPLDVVVRAMGEEEEANYPVIANCTSAVATRTYIIDSADVAVMTCIVAKGHDAMARAAAAGVKLQPGRMMALMSPRCAIADKGRVVSPVTFNLSVPQLRVGAARTGLVCGVTSVAEFQVVLVAGQLKWTAWKRFSDFAALAALLDPVRYRRTLGVWGNIKASKKPWRCLEVPYLGRKCRMLEALMQQVLWESASPLILLKFLNGQLH